MPAAEKTSERNPDGFTPYDPKAPVPSEAEARRDPEAAKTREAQAERVKEIAVKEHGPESVKRKNPSFPVAEGNPHGHKEADKPSTSMSPAVDDANRIGLGPRFRGPMANADVQPIESNPELLAAVQDPYAERPDDSTIATVVTLDSYGNPVTMPV